MVTSDDDGDAHSLFSQAVHDQPDAYGSLVQDGAKRSRRQAGKQAQK